MKPLAVILIIIHFVLLALFALTGLALQTSGWKTFAVLCILGIIFFSTGLRLLFKKNADEKTRKRGYHLMLLACIPLLPMSLLFGMIPARIFARRLGLLKTEVVGAPSMIPKNETSASPASSAQEHPNERKFYARKILGPIPFWIGVVFAVIMVIAVVSGGWGVVGTFFAPTFIFLFFGGANRKPRMTLTSAYLEVVPNSMGPAKRISLSQISDISIEPKFLIHVKDGSAVRMARFEFSKHTRAAFRAAVHGRLPA